MNASRFRGVTIVEVVVALAILSLNVIGWSALIRLVVVLLQRASGLLASGDGHDLVDLCSLGLVAIAPQPPGARRGLDLKASVGNARRPEDRRGFTLVEILVTLALASLLFGLLAAGFASVTRFSRAALATGDALAVRLALPTMLQNAIQGAGRGVSDGCALALDASGRRLAVSFLSAGEVVVDEVFAGLDGGGRPALYLRRVPHVRQPWLEEVTSFQVLDHELDADGRVAAMLLRLDHLALDGALDVRVALPHRPCLEVAP